MADTLPLIPIIRDAIYHRRQLVFIAAGHQREACPHRLGTTRGIWRMLCWQFGGSCREGDLPGWRCFALPDIASGVEVRDGTWHRGWKTAGDHQTCIDYAFAEVSPAYGPESRGSASLRVRSPADLCTWCEPKR